MPGGLPGPNTNFQGRRAPEVGLIVRFDNTLQQWEKGYVEAALMITQGNLSQAAKLLGIHRTTLYSRMQNYGTPGEPQSPPQ